jgi:hypothetical protein
MLAQAVESMEQVKQLGKEENHNRGLNHPSQPRNLAHNLPGKGHNDQNSGENLHGDYDDAAEAVSLPVFMLAQAVESMEQVKQLGKEARSLRCPAPTGRICRRFC